MKKKIRYSEFNTPLTPTPTRPTPVSAPAVAPAPATAPPEPVVPASASVAEAPVVPGPELPPARVRRNSAPIDLARALAAARNAEALQEASIMAAVDARTAAARAARMTPVEPSAPVPPSAPAVDVERVASVEDPADAEPLDADVSELFEPRGPRRPLRDRVRARSGTVELLMFVVGTERFAVELVCVEEAIDLPDVHHVPEMPPAMLGVVTVRDVLTPVYRPDTSLGVPVLGHGAALIFRAERGRFALAIDDVDDVLTLDLATLRDAPGVDGAESVVLGVARSGGRLVALLDADALILACQSIPALEPA